ncbi:MAG: hypothetical protein AAF804_10275 [Bacteroidota bacterium]
MSKIKLTVSVPHIQKDYDVELPDSTTGKRLFEALTKKLAGSGGSGDNEVYELFSKKAGLKVYPDLKDQSLKQMGIQPGDTVILKKDMDPGAWPRVTF